MPSLYIYKGKVKFSQNENNLYAIDLQNKLHPATFDQKKRKLHATMVTTLQENKKFYTAQQFESNIFSPPKKLKFFSLPKKIKDSSPPKKKSEKKVEPKYCTPTWRLQFQSNIFSPPKKLKFFSPPKKLKILHPPPQKKI